LRVAEAVVCDGILLGHTANTIGASLQESWHILKNLERLNLEPPRTKNLATTIVLKALHALIRANLCLKSRFRSG
jgi:cobalamin biosynthesis protein CbiG